MNLHVPQSYSSRVELQELAAVPYQIISPANNGAIIKLVQDSLLGYYLITDDKIRIDKRDMMNILMGVPNFNGILPKPHEDEGNKQLWTGKQLISIALPRINMSNSGIVIKNGELIKGRVGKGASSDIIRVVYNDYGPKICQEYLDNIQNIVTRFLIKHGFSIGISDLIITDDVKKEIQDIIVEGKKEVLDLEKKVHLNIMTDIKKNAHDTFEATVRSIMSKTTEKVNKLYKGHLKDDNRAVMMKNAGSKGSDFNIQQMSTHLGQQIVQGKRVPIGYTDRTLPHYYRYDSDVISRGFVENSFMDGLTPQEAFFHAMGGREGLIDTAVKSVTGDTPIVIITKSRKPSGMKNGRKFKRTGSIKYINIGEWIDKLLHENHDNVRYEPKENNLELLALDLDNHIYIPTTDYDGKVTWGEITCVTRHDPGHKLYKITTGGGRSVIVTASKSLLIWNNETKQFKEQLTTDIKVGDAVPVTGKLSQPPINLNSACSIYECGEEYGKSFQLDKNNREDCEQLLLACDEYIQGFISQINTTDNFTDMELNVYNMLKSRVETNTDDFHNDVMLDHIIDITEIDPTTDAKYNKMYDLTIPSTLNFGLANGLQVRDTSESGYIQRKLIKAMEDLKVYHDQTVRNANGDIVQFLYGYDGIDASGGIEGNYMELVVDEYATIKDKMHFSDNENWETFMSKSAIKKMKSDKNWKKKLDNYFKMLMDDRDTLFKVFNYTANTNMESIHCPFNIERTVNNTIQTFKIRENGLSDLSPIQVIEAVEDLCEHITINGFPNFNFNLVIKSKLAPKMVLKKYRLTKLAFDHAINLIKMKFNSAIVQAGEMVGLLSAQSLGETSTQLTLNSITGETQILINEDGKNKVTEIGKWIDAKLRHSQDKVQHIPRNRTQYLELNEKVMIPSCDMEGNTGWHQLTAVTKHLPVGDLVKITTQSGRTVTATQAKSFLIWDDDKSELVRTNGSDVKVGDRVPVTYRITENVDNISNKGFNEFIPKQNDMIESDVILDPIKTIEYLKNTDDNGDMINVYDVTVPSTLNFMVKGGLNLNDTFHSSGSGATITTQGVPRLRELLSNTKNMSTPSSTLFLDDESRYSLEKALEVKYNIEITTIRDIVISCSIYNDPDNKFKSVIDEDRNILEIYKVFSDMDDNCKETKANPWVLRFKFDRSKMMERKISMDNIYQVITQAYSNALCVYSDDNSNDLIFRIRLDFVASTDKADDDIKLLKKVENKLLDLVVKGVDGIDSSHVGEHNINLVKDEIGNYVTKSERKLTTDGSNLIELTNMTNINHSRCYSNDVNEVYTLYGIEAARTVLYNEFDLIVNSSSVNSRHIAMLCDIMTNQGIIMSIDRHGINRGTNGPLAKCSFEEAVDQLQKAAIHGDRDNLNGVSANVMMGQIPPSGTGDSTLILDELKLKVTQDVDKQEDELNIDDILNVSDYCQDNVGMNFNINKIKRKKINVNNIPKVKPE